MYVTILQLLRLSSEYIREVMDNLENLKMDFSISVRTAPDAVVSNWEKLISYQSQMGHQLLRRIKSKIAQVKSLREEVRVMQTSMSIPSYQ